MSPLLRVLDLPLCPQKPQIRCSHHHMLQPKESETMPNLGVILNITTLNLRMEVIKCPDKRKIIRFIIIFFYVHTSIREQSQQTEMSLITNCHRPSYQSTRYQLFQWQHKEWWGDDMVLLRHKILLQISIVISTIKTNIWFSGNSRDILSYIPTLDCAY